MKSILCVVILAFALILSPAIGKTTNIFEITSPFSKMYTEYVDYAPFDYSAFGDVTATLERVGGTELGYPGDFSSFTAGNIALIKRGFLLFREKVENAEAAGAFGAIIYNQNSGLNLGTLQYASTSIPSISVSDTVGLELIGYLDLHGNITIHLNIDTPLGSPSPIPEPATMLLLGSGLIGLAGYGRRRLLRK